METPNGLGIESCEADPLLLRLLLKLAPRGDGTAGELDRLDMLERLEKLDDC